MVYRTHFQSTVKICGSKYIFFLSTASLFYIESIRYVLLYLFAAGFIAVSKKFSSAVIIIGVIAID